MSTFNLLDEPWIPCLGNDGTVQRLGIREVLTRAGRIRQIAASNPMDRVAVLRFLLALLYWCQGNPPSGTDFPADWSKKLEQYRECFNLLGEGKRFYQYRKDGDKPLAVNYLIHEVPTGTNWWHFRHSTDGLEGLCPPCCAMGLLRLPAFSTSGGRGKSPGINQKPPLYMIPLGESLAHTLRLSWRPVLALGTPAWEKPDLPLPGTGEVPLLTGLTWLPRRVWLDSPQEVEGNCISCGARARLITSAVFAGIGSTKTEADDSGRVWRDPHVVYEQGRKGGAAPLHARDALGSADAAAGQWAEVMASIFRGERVLDDPGKTGSVRLWVVGFATVQNDKYLEAIEHTFPLPGTPDQAEALVKLVEQWRSETSSLVRKALPQQKKRGSQKHPELHASIAAIRPHVEGSVSAEMGNLLKGDVSAWEGAALQYHPMMEAVAHSLSPGFTTAAIQRRGQISRTLPDMANKKAPARQAGTRRGGAE